MQECIFNKINLIESEELIEEFVRVMLRPKFDFILNEKKEEFVESLIEISELVKSDVKVNVIKEDEPDNRVLECAEAGKVDYIISGDKHLLKLKEYKNIPIIEAAEFLRYRKD
ncbi:MAG: putative toxin-antitoxin system toxin component, PIN family [bacterium]